jgi:DsbC/DsbD-like thiol-disulfide interchange protein
MTFLHALLLALLPILSFALPPDDDLPRQHATPSLIREHADLIPGKVNDLAVHFQIERKWHIYWDGMNDTGFAPEIKLTAPEGYEVKPILWPAPKRHVGEGDILDHIYEDAVTLILPVLVPADAKPGTRVEFTADCRWLVCDKICVPEDRSVRMSASVGRPDDKPKASDDARLFAAARLHLPKPWPKDGTVTATWEGRNLILRSARALKIEFMPGKDSPIPQNLAREGEAAGDALRLKFAGLKTARDAAKLIDGIVAVTRPDPDNRKEPKVDFYHLQIPPPSKD